MEVFIVVSIMVIGEYVMFFFVFVGVSLLLILLRIKIVALESL